MQPNQGSNFGPVYFIARLEALRGVAAMMVAVWHSMWVLTLSGLQGTITACLSRLCNGLAAVTIFFVLSGFVLGLSLRNAGACSWKLFWGFSLRRVFRIYPVFFISTVLVLVFVFCSPCFGLVPSWFPWASDYNKQELNPSRPPGLMDVVLNLLMWSPSLNYPTWTLGIELRCSLLLVLLHWCSQRLSGSGKGLLLLALLAIAGIGKWCLVFGFVRAEALFALYYKGFAGYLFLFYLGYLLPEIGPSVLANLSASMPGRILLPWAPAIVWLWGDSWGDDLRFLQGIAAALVIGDLVYGRERVFWRLLDERMAKFYGRISFSFYLWHDLALVACARLLQHFFPPSCSPSGSVLCSAGLIAGSIAITTAIASLCYKFVERPCIGFGKRITAA